MVLAVLWNVLTNTSKITDRRSFFIIIQAIHFVRVSASEKISSKFIPPSAFCEEGLIGIKKEILLILLGKALLN